MLTRAWRADFNVADSEGRIISGIAVPYNSPTTIYEMGRVFDETWARGATKETIAKRGDRMKLLAFHDSRSMPLGRPVGLEDRADGMFIEARISDTSGGNDALTLVRDGVLDGFSVGFSIPEGGDAWSKDGQTRTIKRADVHEVSLVNFPAFDDARVAAIREAAEPGSVGADSTFELVEEDREDEEAARVIAVRHRLQLLRLELVSRRISA